MNNHEEREIAVNEPAPEAAPAGGIPPKYWMFLAGSILVSSLIISGTWVYTARLKAAGPRSAADIASGLEKTILPEKGVELPVEWGNAVPELVKSGALSADKFRKVYAQRGGVSPEVEKILAGEDTGKIRITEKNAGQLLNILWGLGLANENPILLEGEMTSKDYGGDASRFASTGGWTLGEGKVMSHYAHHKLMNLTEAQQKRVDDVSQHIFRPCCGNSTHFPDCNHGMAMLGLLELMASQNASEEEMYKAALAVNVYWFPDNYLTIGTLLAEKGIKWNEADPKALLSEQFSSAQGYRQVQSQVAEPAARQSGGSCGV